MNQEKWPVLTEAKTQKGSAPVNDQTFPKHQRTQNFQKEKIK